MTTITCSSCGAECLYEAEYCDTCGKKFRQSTDKNAHIMLTTGDLHRPYELVDCICFVSSQDRGLAGRNVLDAAFEDAKRGLRKLCADLGGEAVVGCHFSERSAHSGGLLPTQVIEIWSYGTAVKFVSS